MASPVSGGCSDDFDAAETFAASLMDQIDSESVRNMIDVQKDMLSRFEKTNEMLINFNILSANRYAVTSQQYRRHTQLIYEMRRDLDSIFKRIRVLKHKLGKAYPESFKVCGNSEPILEDEEEFEGESGATGDKKPVAEKPVYFRGSEDIVDGREKHDSSDNSGTDKSSGNKVDAMKNAADSLIDHPSVTQEQPLKNLVHQHTVG